jgi:hypothetical protein
MFILYQNGATGINFLAKFTPLQKDDHNSHKQINITSATFQKANILVNK